MDKLKRPVIGDIVHYIDYRSIHYPAIVTAVSDSITDGSRVSLFVMTITERYNIEEANHRLPEEVEKYGTEDTWHWPE